MKSMMTIDKSFLLFWRVFKERELMMSLNKSIGVSIDRFQLGSVVPALLELSCDKKLVVMETGKRYIGK